VCVLGRSKDGGAGNRLRSLDLCYARKFAHVVRGGGGFGETGTGPLRTWRVRDDASGADKVLRALYRHIPSFLEINDGSDLFHAGVM
jgi:hypothetical protein